MDVHKKTNRIIAFFVFLVSFLVYFRTIAPTTSFWDCGEFITCSYILGIPHPPGAPLYLLLGRVFSLLPWAVDIGLRVNLISSVVTALSVMFTYLITVLLIRFWRGGPRSTSDKLIIYCSGIVSAFALAFSDSVWFNAVEAEVYAISLFFTTLTVWLILVWYENADSPQSDRYLLLIAYIVGLAIGVHLLNILALPAVFLLLYFKFRKFEIKSFMIFMVIALILFAAIYPGIVKTIPKLALTYSGWFFVFVALVLLAGIIYAIRSDHKVSLLLLMSFFLIIIGTTTYSMIYIRSNLDPVIDENDPETLENFVSYLNREQYGDWSYVERRAPFWEYQIKKMYIRYLGWQFIGKGETIGQDGFIAETISFNGLYAIPFLIGIFGMVHHFFKDRKRALFILILFLMTGLAIIIYLNQPEPQPRERDYVYVGSFFAFALWIGIGVAGLMESALDIFSKKSKQFQIKAISLISLLAILAIPVNMLAFNYHTHDRSGNYVAFDYSYNILQSCDENAILYTNGDNDTFPIWFLQYVYNIRPDIRVVNLSLLNTPWYIKQLKYQEPRVPISLSDAEINKLAIKRWPESKTITMPVPPEVFQKDLNELGDRTSLIPPKDTPTISFEMPPTLMNQAIRVQDWLILNIMFTNKFEKPIYFSVTVATENMLNLEDYLRMDGLTYKLVTYPGEKISPQKLRHNLFDKFQYRNLDNPDVYLNDDIIGLLTNYRAGFLRLASFYSKEKMYPELLETLHKMEEKVPENIITIDDPRLTISIGQLYKEAGAPEELEKRLVRLLNKTSEIDEKLQYGQLFYHLLDDSQRAESIATTIIGQSPNYSRAYYFLLNLYSQTNEFKKGIDLAEKLLSINPDDMQAQIYLNRFKTLTNGDSVSINQ
ncbi:DUF2723 domain-containing protein [candidate division KSB1 bacterium]|nr:DUF2723 domain-containing protein [candidate division KSB1 bacterium]